MYIYEEIYWWKLVSVGTYKFGENTHVTWLVVNNMYGIRYSIYMCIYSVHLIFSAFCGVTIGAICHWYLTINKRPH